MVYQTPLLISQIIEAIDVKAPKKAQKRELRTKLPFALFGQIKQPFTLLSKLNREMPFF